MISNPFPRRDSKASMARSSAPQVELQRQIGEALREMYDLLEQYAPAWYPQQLHEKVDSLLRLIEK